MPLICLFHSPSTVHIIIIMIVYIVYEPIMYIKFWYINFTCITFVYQNLMYIEGCNSITNNDMKLILCVSIHRHLKSMFNEF